MKFNVKKYSKFIVALVGFFVVIGGAFADGELSEKEIAAIFGAGVTAAGVFSVPNDQKTKEEQEILDESGDVAQ